METNRAKRPTCTCRAYPWPHRPGGGLCRYPDPPAATWQGIPGRTPTDLRRRGIRKFLLNQYRLHPIRDREKIKRFLPKLYRAYIRRNGDWNPTGLFGSTGMASGATTRPPAQ